MADLTKLSIREADHQIDGHGHHVLHVRDPHALIQAVGYLKYRCASEGDAVYFRGQSSSYASLSPSLFRGIGATQNAQSSRVKLTREFIRDVKSQHRIFDQINELAHEPLLQHYGLSTTWLDIVDNIWVALWFACYKAYSSGKNNRYIHFERGNTLFLI
jgi:hypothetical protein